MDPRSAPNLLDALGGAIQTADALFDKRYRIEAQTQQTAAETALAWRMDEFVRGLDRDNDYANYNKKWKEAQQQLLSEMKSGTIVGMDGQQIQLSNADALRAVEQSFARMSSTQDVQIKRASDKMWAQDTDAKTTAALSTRLKQTTIPTQAKMVDITETFRYLNENGIISPYERQRRAAAAGDMVIQQDMLSKARNIYSSAASGADGGPADPARALNAAEKFIAEYAETYALDGITIGPSDTAKESVSGAIKDVYLINERERKAAYDANFQKEDGRLYGAFSAFVSGQPGYMTNRMIDESNLPVERKMYWRQQLEQAIADKDKPDGLEEAQANDLWNRLNVAKTELKRAGGTFTADKTIKIGDKTYTFRDYRGLENILRSNYQLFTKVYGKTFAEMQDGFIGDLDKPVGLQEEMRDRILGLAKAKSNPIPDWEASQFSMAWESFWQNNKGDVTPEKAEEWYKSTVERPRMNKIVREIQFGRTFFADNDDEITTAMDKGEFRNDIADGRVWNPRTKESLNAYAQAFERKTAEALGVKLAKDGGNYSMMWTSGSKEPGRIWFNRENPEKGIRAESVTPRPFGANHETGLVRERRPTSGPSRFDAWDDKSKKWLPAAPSKTEPGVWYFTADPRKMEQEEARKAKDAVKEQVRTGNIYTPSLSDPLGF